MCLYIPTYSWSRHQLVSALRFGRFTSGESALEYLLDIWQGGPQRRSGLRGEVNSCPHRDSNSDFSTTQPVARLQRQGDYESNESVDATIAKVKRCTIAFWRALSLYAHERFSFCSMKIAGSYVCRGSGEARICFVCIRLCGWSQGDVLLFRRLPWSRRDDGFGRGLQFLFCGSQW